MEQACVTQLLSSVVEVKMRARTHRSAFTGRVFTAAQAREKHPRSVSKPSVRQAPPKASTASPLWPEGRLIGWWSWTGVSVFKDL